MLHSDEFVFLIPLDGLPVLAEPGDDLSPYVGVPFERFTETFALRNGRSVKGSIFRAKPMNAGHHLYIVDALNEKFAKA